MARWNMIVFLFKLVFSIKLTVHRICLEKKREREKGKRGRNEGENEERKKNKSLRLSSSKVPR